MMWDLSLKLEDHTEETAGSQWPLKVSFVRNPRSHVKGEERRHDCFFFHFPLKVRMTDVSPNSSWRHEWSRRAGSSPLPFTPQARTRHSDYINTNALVEEL